MKPIFMIHIISSYTWNSKKSCLFIWSSFLFSRKWQEMSNVIAFYTSSGFFWCYYLSILLNVWFWFFKCDLQENWEKQHTNKIVEQESNEGSNKSNQTSQKKTRVTKHFSITVIWGRRARVVAWTSTRVASIKSASCVHNSFLLSV